MNVNLSRVADASSIERSRDVKFNLDSRFAASLAPRPEHARIRGFRVAVAGRPEGHDRRDRPVGRPKRVFNWDAVVRLLDQEGMSLPKIVKAGEVVRAYRAHSDPPVLSCGMARIPDYLGFWSIRHQIQWFGVNTGGLAATHDGGILPLRQGFVR